MPFPPRLAWVAIVIAVAACGCAAEPRRRSVEDVFQQAEDGLKSRRPRSPEPFRELATASGGSAVSSLSSLAAAQPASPMLLPPITREAPSPTAALASFEAPLPETLPHPHGVPLGATGSAPVSDTFIETDIRQAVQSLAAQAKASVILDEEVRGTATAVIENEPFEKALEKILLPLGYVYKRRGDEYLVGLSKPESALFSLIAQRYDYDALHRSPRELLALVPERHKPFLRTGEKGSLIIVEAPDLIAEQILTDLRRSDQPAEQVVLEALIVIYSPETNFRFGFDLEQGVQFQGNAISLGLSGLAVTGGYRPATAGNLNNFQFASAFLRALEQEGYLDIRAAPRVMAKDGEKAQISIARETFFSVQPPESGLLIRQDVQRVEAGIVLDIVPEIRGSRITVRIENAEVSEDIRTEETRTQAADRFPVINRRRVATTVHVGDGETIVIGGLSQTQKVSQVNKIPGLGDIPLVGRLFRRIEEKEQEAEVAIFLSPRIVPLEPEHAASCP